MSQTPLPNSTNRSSRLAQRHFVASVMAASFVRFLDWADDYRGTQRWVRNTLGRRLGLSCYMPHQGAKECGRRAGNGVRLSARADWPPIAPWPPPVQRGGKRRSA